MDQSLLWLLSQEPKEKNPIPLNIFQTWATKVLPKDMENNNNLLKLQNPEFTFNLYDDEDCRIFIKDYFDYTVLEAYDKLIPGAYKADLWRLCVLYIYGGIYLDIKLSCVNNFKLISLIHENHFVKDRPYKMLWQGFIISEKKNKILMDGIIQIVSNCKNNYYGKTTLCPTGPSMLGKIYYNSLYYRIKNKNILYFNGSYIIYNGEKIINCTYKTYKKERSITNKIKNTSSYTYLWYTRNIYIQ